MEESRNLARKIAGALISMCVLFAISCAPLTTTLPSKDFPKLGGDGPGYRFTNLVGGKDENRLFVCLTFSGGGTRAAALAYGAMIALKQTRINWPHRETLLDEVDVISSVSGGSFTAAYYGLFTERFFDDFEKVLYRDIQGGLVVQGIEPWHWPWLMSPYYSRIDLAADYYGNTIFENRTYQTLIEQRRRPFIILNATNIGNESRFPFTQEQFDMIGSDLGDFPVARAVAASSAFPFLLSPMTLANHQKLDGFTIPAIYQLGMSDYYENRSHYYWSETQRSYVENPDPYIHLMDGGLADNVGLRPIINAYQQTNGFIQRNLGGIDRLVIISINARTESNNSSGNSRHTPHIIPTVAMATAATAMDNYSFDSVDFANELMGDLRQNVEEVEGGANASGVHTVPYTMEISFEGIADKKRRAQFYGIGTNFHLPAEQVKALISEGCNLLKNDREYRCMLEDIERVATGVPQKTSACADASAGYHPAAVEGIRCPESGGWPI